MSGKSSRGNGTGLKEAKSRKAKGGRGLSPGKRGKIDARKRRIAELDDPTPRVKYGSKAPVQ